jgi:hypothetical protein
MAAKFQQLSVDRVLASACDSNIKYTNQTSEVQIWKAYLNLNLYFKYLLKNPSAGYATRRTHLMMYIRLIYALL